MKELKENKRRLENQILELIENFEKRNDVYLSNIELIHEVYRNIQEEKQIKTKRIIVQIKI